MKAKPKSAPDVFCEVCLKHVPRIDALMDQTPGHAAYFCSARCYQRWSAQRKAPAHPA